MDDSVDYIDSDEAPQLQRTPANKGVKGRQSMSEKKVSFVIPGKNSPAVKTPKKDNQIVAKKQPTPANKSRASLQGKKVQEEGYKKSRTEIINMAKDFEQGVLVWAKMKGFPLWPAKVSFPTDGKLPKSKRPQHYVFFFGTHNHAWILDRHIFPHSEGLLASAKSSKKISSSMKIAIQEIQHAEEKKFELLTKDKLEKESVNPPPSLPKNFPEKTPNKSKKVKVETKTLNVEIQTPRVEKDPSKVEMENHNKRAASAMMSDFDRDGKIKVKKQDLNEDNSVLIANVPPNNGYPNVAVIPTDSYDYKPMLSSVNFNETTSPSSDLIFNSPIKKNDTFSPTSKRIGFLGLGVIGCELVKRLLSTGHSVTIWNKKTLGMYNTLVEMGAKPAKHPADVIQDCDIIVCCVINAEAARCVVFGNNGVLAGFDGPCSNKAYVEMTSLDPVTSHQISEAITGKGGRYLEAPIIGTRQDIINNCVTIVSAGDRSLFIDCDSVFYVWAKHSFFLGCDVGAASKICLILNIMAGTTRAALVRSISIIAILFALLGPNMHSS